MSNEPIRVGLASYGMSGTVFHAPLLTAHPGFRLHTIVERTTNHSPQRYPHVTVVRSFDALLEDETLALVVINTPDYLHYPMAMQALRAGKHVVVEKPFTFTFAEAQTLIALAKQHNKLLSVFQNRRWDGDFQTVQRIVQSERLGQLVAYEASYDRFRNAIEANNWKEGTHPDAPGSGILYNLGAHLIDQALVLFGLPVSITADIRTQRPGGKIPDAYELRLHYPGCQVMLRSSYLVREAGPRYVLHGTEGSFVKYGLDPQEEALKGGAIRGGPAWGQDPESNWGLLNTQIDGLHFRGKIETLPGNYLAYYDNVYQAITQGEALAISAEAGAAVIRVIEAAMESSREKRTVRL